jgi:hypothetical protein
MLFYDDRKVCRLRLKLNCRKTYMMSGTVRILFDSHGGINQIPSDTMFAIFR